MQVTLFGMRTVKGHEKLQCGIMRKAMSKEVGAGGRFDIFLDSAFFHPQENATRGCANSSNRVCTSETSTTYTVYKNYNYINCHCNITV